MRARRVLLLSLVLISLSGCAALVDQTRSAIAPDPPPTPLESHGVPTGGNLSVLYVDVGQGDGTIWRLPEGAHVVYDCGPPAQNASVNPMVRALRGLGLADGGVIQALILSHGHADHIGGCQEILSTFQVKNVYDGWYDGSDETAAYRELKRELLAEGAIVHTLHATSEVPGALVAHRGDALDLGGSAARAEIAYPGRYPPASWSDIAKASLGIRLTYGAVSYCFQGDIEPAEERDLAALPGDHRCDVYLVGHHGSQYASSAPWLATMQPSLAVVSFGNNTYGHPTSEALCRIQSAGAKVYATERDGTITVTTDGHDVSTSAAPETRDYCAAGASYWGQG